MKKPSFDIAALYSLLLANTFFYKESRLTSFYGDHLFYSELYVIYEDVSKSKAT